MSKSEVKLHLVCRTSAGEGDGEYEYAVVEMDLKYTLWLLQQMGIAGVFKGESEQFYRVNYFHAGAEYYRSWDGNWDEMNEETADDYHEAESAIDNSEWYVMPEWWKPNGSAARTECDTLGVDESSVLYNCYPKHGSTEVETQTLTKDIVASIAKQLMEMQAKAAAEAATHLPREHRVVQLDKGAQ